MEPNVEECIKNNIHNRSAADIQKALKEWKVAPLHYVKIDYTYLFKKDEPAAAVESNINDDGADTAVENENVEQNATSNVAEGESQTVIYIY